MQNINMCESWSHLRSFSALQGCRLVYIQFYFFPIIEVLEMEFQEEKIQLFRHLLFFAFHRCQKETEAARAICNTYGEGVITEDAA